MGRTGATAWWLILGLSLGGLACGASTSTRDCQADRDCPSDHRCDQGRCLPDETCTSQGCACEPGGPCDQGLSCRQGRCQAPCPSDAPCEPLPDADGDGVPDPDDVCPAQSDPVQADSDGDGLGDACDDDDDDDGVPDAADNCRITSNQDQSDANGDGIGNACDPSVRGITVTGHLDPSARPDADPAFARVFLNERVEPEKLDAQGRFTFHQALSSSGRFVLAVDWPGFVLWAGSFDAPDRAEVIDVGEISLVRGEDPDAMAIGKAALEGQRDHRGITVRAWRSGRPVAEAVTDAQGRYAATLRRQPHRLEFRKEGFDPVALEVDWNEPLGRFEVAGTPLGDWQGVILSFTERPDTDDDGVIDQLDVCPRFPDPSQRDLDGDGLGDACDRDLDGDGWVNGLDNCPRTFNPSQEDTDGDGLGAVCAEGTPQEPFEVGCGTTGQRLDPSERPDLLASSCGGQGTGELVYRVLVEPLDRVIFQARAAHPLAIYALDLGRGEVACANGGALTLNGRRDQDDPDPEALEPGEYLVVIDGAGGGAVEVDVVRWGCRPSWERLPRIPVEGAPIDIHAVDMTLDGVPELVSLDVGLREATQGYVEVHPGLGALAFGPPSRTPVGQSPLAMVVLDLDGDGVPDVATANRDSDDVSLLVGLGDGTFLPARAFPVGAAPRDIIAGDLDNDGHIDLLTASLDAGSVSILRGRGGGAFERAEAAGGFASGLALADLDADGWPDLVGVDPETHTIQVWRGQGDGTLGPATSWLTGISPLRVRAADINADGHLDLISLNASSEDFDILWGHGDGTFSDPTVVSGGSGLFDMILDDLDRDGRLDLAMTTRINLLVSLGLPGGAFDRQRNHNPGIEPVALAHGDLNADGWPELLVTSLAAQHLHVFEAVPPARQDPRLTIAARPTRAAHLPLCPPATVLASAIEGDAARWRLSPEVPCRIARLALDLDAPPGPVTLRSPLGHAVALSAPLAPLLAPESMALVGLEGHPLGGLWRLEASAPIRAAALHINPAPPDPLDPLHPNPPCQEGADQPEVLDALCTVLSNASLRGLTIADAQDRDVFLLLGPLEGGFAVGQRISVEVTTAPQAPALRVSLGPPNAPHHAALAVAGEPGRWTLTWTVPDDLRLRWLAVRVEPVEPVPSPVPYDLDVRRLP